MKKILFFATSNSHKLKELHAMLSDLYELKSLRDFPEIGGHSRNWSLFQRECSYQGDSTS